MHGTATKLRNERKIALDGVVKGEVKFDGSQDVTINTTLNNIAVVSAHFDNLSGQEFDATAIKFPNGFTKDNCTIINISHKEDASTSSAKNYFTTGIAANSSIGSITASMGWEGRRPS